MVCEPTARVEMAQVAALAATVWAAQLPMLAAPSLKVTLPVGVPAPGLVTLMVAVKVTVWPNTVGVPLVASATVVFAFATTWLTEGEGADARKLPSPL